MLRFVSIDRWCRDVGRAAEAAEPRQFLRVDLLGGIRPGICTRDTRYTDGRPIIGTGIQPDVEVHPTQQDIAEGADLVLAKAIDLLNEGRR